MKKQLSVLSVLVLLVGLLAVGGCGVKSTNTPSQNAQAVTLDAKEALPQLAGIAQSAAAILKESPLAVTEQGKAAIGWADSVATFSTNMQQGLASKDQVAGAYTALRNTAAALPLDAKTMASLSPYFAWGDVAAQALDLAMNIIKGAQAPSTASPDPAATVNPTSLLLPPQGSSSPACSSWVFPAVAACGSWSRLEA